MDFTISTYRSLLESLAVQGHTFQPYAGFLENPASRCIILRHDVEARYRNALEMAKIQHAKGIRGTYYFRFLPGHFDTGIIREIAAMGHEIGYHYDDLSHCKGDYEKALMRFEKNLATLREIAPVKTICMEGAPLSKWDNRDLWGKHQIPNSKFQTNSKNEIQNSQNPEPGTRNPKHYRDYGIIGEPYFDTDFSDVYYLTDTGRRWDGKGVSIRDKANPEFQIPNSKQTQNSKSKIQNLKLHSTTDIIAAAEAGLLPDRIMFTFHPQRWTDEPLPWLRELVMQNLKNVAKKIVLRVKG
ncbi:MAG: hypothetical protein RBS55_13655 [Bacteroidales bacterium]|nr:hypothetical protein [Bacteroidales bacterium]